MDNLLAGTLISLIRGVFNAGILSSVAAAPPVHRWKTFRSKPNAIPAGDQKLFAFPPESAFTFRPEYCSDSQRNGVRLQTGIAFIFDRIPQMTTLRACINLPAQLRIAVRPTSN
jgi:hypothetical protein